MRQPERSRPGGSAASGVEAPGDCARLVLGEASHAHPLGYPPRLAGARSRGARLDHRGRECPVTSSGKKLPLLSLGPLGAGVPTHVCRLRSPWPFLLLAPPCTPRRPPRSSPHRLCTPPAGVSAPACRSCRPGTRQVPGATCAVRVASGRLCIAAGMLSRLRQLSRYDRKCGRSEHRSLVPNAGTPASRGEVLLALN